MNRVLDKQKRRLRRKNHIRKTVSGTPECPRLSVYRSNKHLYVQAIDDVAGNTLVSASSIESELKTLKNTVSDAEKLGTVIGERLKEKKIETVKFDRNGFLFHGIVKSIADGARKTGIKF